MLHNPDYDWSFETIPQVHHLARGKMVGGSSGINFMAYGWTWDALEPYYHKSETLLPDSVPGPRQDYFVRNPDFHGDSGPVALSWPPSPANINDAVVQAISEVSVPYERKDPYGGHHLGFARTCRRLIKGLPTISARGVKFPYNGNEHEVMASREVILSASSIQAPNCWSYPASGTPPSCKQLVFLAASTFPRWARTSKSIHWESRRTSYLIKSPENVTLDSVITDQVVFQAQLKRLLETLDGLLAGSTGLIGFIPERMLRLLHNPEAAVIEVVGMPCNFDVAAGHADQSRLIPGPPPDFNDCFTLMVSALYTMSRGSTHIAPATLGDGRDPRTEPPRIDLASLSHPADMDVLAACITMADPAFRTGHLTGRTLRCVSPPEGVDLEDVDQAREYVRDSIMVFNHNLGTCAMGRVVDERLRVKEMAGRRVVDCSVNPETQTRSVPIR
ncbi:putative aryl-alcohol dehydrogenase [Coniochaeta sp. 2T2.1]|nr:putative aryl-alcohol dehydrogenase [Coniochaeta sp. 2T2.1]